MMKKASWILLIALAVAAPVHAAAGDTAADLAGVDLAAPPKGSPSVPPAPIALPPTGRRGGPCDDAIPRSMLCFSPLSL
jgi:hypothetical protein